MSAIIIAIFLIYLILAIKYRFMPFGRIKKHLNNGKGFNSLMMLLASSMGVGNIVGVGVAIYLAGPGVLFWMLVSALFSATTNYLEVYHSKKNANYNYAPISYIDNKFMVIVYTIIMILTSLFIGNMTQVNSIAIALSKFNLYLLGFILCFIFLLATFKYENISRVLNLIMPVCTICYLLIDFFLIIKNNASLGLAIKQIWLGAFRPLSTIGIPFFYVFSQGILFAVFSNEAGNGSSAMAFRNAVGEPADLGVVASLGPIIDTAVICILSGLIILTNEKYGNYGYLNYSPNEVIYILDIFDMEFGKFGNFLMSFFVVLFAFATLLSWFYYAIIGVKYLKIPYFAFQLGYLLVLFISLFLQLTFLLDLANYFNVLLLLINLYYLCKKCLKRIKV